MLFNQVETQSMVEEVRTVLLLIFQTSRSGVLKFLYHFYRVSQKKRPFVFDRP